MNKIISFILILLIAPQIDSAYKYLYVREKASNSSPEIDSWNRYVGNPKGAPWCAAFASSMIKSVSPLKSGSAKGLITKKSIPASAVLRGTKVPPGSLVVWTQGNTPRGHVEIVVEWNGVSGTTIGGNTSSGERGSQADGDGVFLRKRRIEPFSEFRIIYFTPV